LSVIGYEKILQLVKKSPPLMENVEEKNIQPSGVDLRAKCIYKLKNGGFIGIKERKTPEIDVSCNEIGKKITIEPNEYVLVETIEKVNMPKDLMATVLPRSSLFRCGVTIFTAVVDPGFQGTLTFGMKNISEFPFEIEVGSRIGQIVFKEVEDNVKLYNGKYQGGKVT
jgi:deoxycytidine triphosphate deaminase